MELEMPYKVQRNLRQLELELERFFIPFFSFLPWLKSNRGGSLKALNSQWAISSVLTMEQTATEYSSWETENVVHLLKDEIHQTATHKSRTEY